MTDINAYRQSLAARTPLIDRHSAARRKVLRADTASAEPNTAIGRALRRLAEQKPENDTDS